MHKKLCLFIGMMFVAAPALAEQPQASLLEIDASACERLIGNESKASARIRAADKATFSALKKLNDVSTAAQNLSNDDLNIFIYRLVDEYVENLMVRTIEAEEGSVCVKVQGEINAQSIGKVAQDFGDSSFEPQAETVAIAAKEAKEQITIKPDDPENLALVYIDDLQYYNGAKTSKFTEELATHFKENAYFYLTTEEELADYILKPQVLKAKIDKLDAGHKRLQVVVTIDINGANIQKDTEYENRFVLFGAEENEQQIAARLIKKLLNDAARDVISKIEKREQQKFEQKTLGKVISE